MFENISRWLRKGRGSKNEGKSRLQLILINDRTGVSPEILDNLRLDLFRVISEYFEIKEDDVRSYLIETIRKVNEINKLDMGTFQLGAGKYKIAKYIMLKDFLAKLTGPVYFSKLPDELKGMIDKWA